MVGRGEASDSRLACRKVGRTPLRGDHAEGADQRKQFERCYSRGWPACSSPSAITSQRSWPAPSSGTPRSSIAASAGTRRLT